MMDRIRDDSATRYCVEEDPSCSNECDSVGFSVIVESFSSDGFAPVFPH
jgi:hypothetical protein